MPRKQKHNRKKTVNGTRNETELSVQVEVSEETSNNTDSNENVFTKKKKSDTRTIENAPKNKNNVLKPTTKPEVAPDVLVVGSTKKQNIHVQNDISGGETLTRRSRIKGAFKAGYKRAMNERNRRQRARRGQF